MIFELYNNTEINILISNDTTHSSNNEKAKDNIINTIKTCEETFYKC